MIEVRYIDMRIGTFNNFDDIFKLSEEVQLSIRTLYCGGNKLKELPK